MHHTQILSGTPSTNQLLANLNLAIDEARIVRKIVDLGDHLRRIENRTDEIDKARFLQHEIDHSEDQLVVLRSMMDSVSISFGFSNFMN